MASPGQHIERLQGLNLWGSCFGSRTRSSRLKLQGALGETTETSTAYVASPVVFGRPTSYCMLGYSVRDCGIVQYDGRLPTNLNPQVSATFNVEPQTPSPQP